MTGAQAVRTVSVKGTGSQACSEGGGISKLRIAWLRPTQNSSHSRPMSAGVCRCGTGASAKGWKRRMWRAVD
jgi:hypothetical protein